MYNLEEREFLPEYRGALIAIRGPGVNYAWWHYNPVFESNESSLWAWFTLVMEPHPHVEVWTVTGRAYRENATHTYAVIQVYWDCEYGRPVLLVAGLRGVGTRGACEWLAARILDRSVLGEEYAAIILAISIADYRNVTVVERIATEP